MQRFVSLTTAMLAACAPAAAPPAATAPIVSAAATPNSPATSTAKAQPAFLWRVEGTAKSHLGHGIEPPSEQAWKTASAATLWGAKKLGCKARFAKGWLRIDCPFTVNKPDQPVFVGDGNGAWRARWDKTSFTLALPVAHGLETRLIVDAGKEGVNVALQWRLHRPRPKVLGYINDAAIPRCEGKLPGAGAAFESGIEDCARVGYESCDELAKCLRGEPSHRPGCPDGWKFMVYCAYPCQTVDDCAPGWACSKGADGSPVCLMK